MKIRFSSDLIKILQKIKRKDKKLIVQINKQLKLFRSQPKHHSLKTHKLSGKLQNRWSISINKSVRMVYIMLSRNEAYFISVGTHDMVYRK